MATLPCCSLSRCTSCSFSTGDMPPRACSGAMPAAPASAATVAGASPESMCTLHAQAHTAHARSHRSLSLSRRRTRDSAPLDFAAPRRAPL